MLRALVFILMLLNLAYFAWSQGYLGATPETLWQPREPQRLQEQVKAEALQLRLSTSRTPPGSAPAAGSAPASTPASNSAVASTSAASTSDTPPTASPTATPSTPEETRNTCLMAGPLDAQTAANVRSTASRLLSNEQWELVRLTPPQRWIVYMGRFKDTTALNRKKAELRTLRVSFEPVLNATLEPGLSLGAYNTQESAQRALDQLASKGVRTAEVVEDTRQVENYMFRLPDVQDSVKARLDDIRISLGSASGLRLCRS